MSLVILNSDQIKVREILVLQWEDWSGLQLHTTEVNIKNNDLKVKRMKNSLSHF